jgi:hypothetical protein
MTDKIDRYGNPINVGDIIAYYGTNVGFLIGTVVKFNPKSYRIMYKGKNKHNKDNFFYHNVLFSDSYRTVNAKTFLQLRPEDLIDDLEKQRLGLIT